MQLQEVNGIMRNLYDEDKMMVKKNGNYLLLIINGNYLLFIIDIFKDTIRKDKSMKLGYLLVNHHCFDSLDTRWK